jgi:hypothetical protein
MLCCQVEVIHPNMVITRKISLYYDGAVRIMIIRDYRSP